MKQVEVASTSIKTEYFGSLTERMNKYREDVLNKKPYIDAERAVLATKAYDRYKEQPNVLKRAYMLKEILENMTIYIEDESMIAGNQASSNKDAPIFPERCDTTELLFRFFRNIEDVTIPLFKKIQFLQNEL